MLSSPIFPILCYQVFVSIFCYLKLGTWKKANIKQDWAGGGKKESTIAPCASLATNFFLCLTEKGHHVQIPCKDAFWAMSESVFPVSCLLAGITLMTFKPFFTSLPFGDLHHLFLLLHHVREVFVTVSLLAMNVPVTKLHPNLLSPLLVEAVIGFWCCLELAWATEGWSES